MGRPATTFLKDYRPLDYVVDSIDLTFHLDPDCTRVESCLRVRRREGVSAAAVFALYGRDISLQSVALDGSPLPASRYRLDDENLVLVDPPREFTLDVTTQIEPAKNTELQGLYVSNGKFFTQCEAEGFRRITYFPDRPDVLSRYQTTIIADRTQFPVLLSNGNPVDRGDGPGNTHWVRWQDPFPKPSYLFALVAGDFACVEDDYTTVSGRRVSLRMFVEHGDEDKCLHALASLQRAMRWDEDTYGREYDLDIYMVVAVGDFNMGAMENKGLNIFNSKYVLASAATATDQDYQAIESIIGHEYFHNWSGNRVTCRDWFQLSLKEGFTVFRDQEFTSDLHSRGVKRINDVNILRTQQFREDAGPAAHPVRPESYIEINNFYTVTIYNKGAEVVRMLRTLVGAETFRRATDLYFSRFDGQAVTTDDFVAAVEEVSGLDLSQFKLWYSQAGTPTVDVEGVVDEGARRYRLTLRQSCPPTPGQPQKSPFCIPVAVAFFSPVTAQRLPVRLHGDAGPWRDEQTLTLVAPEQTFVFEFKDPVAAPIPSLLRGFSAPVKLNAKPPVEDLLFLWANDDDEFNRWEAGQHLAIDELLRLIQAQRSGAAATVADAYVEGFAKNLQSTELNRLFQAQLLRIPDEIYVSEFTSPIDPQLIHDAWRQMRRELAERLEKTLTAVFDANNRHEPYSIDPLAIGRRAVKYACLAFMTELPDPRHVRLVYDEYRRADNMTDRISALAILANLECEERFHALNEFYETWQDNANVLDKWFAVQAASRLSDALDAVRSLTDHPRFKPTNPNRVRALLGTFCFNNPVNFHRPDGAGYAFVKSWILKIDRLNPQLSARLVSSFAQWRKFEPQRRAKMEAQLREMAAAPDLSKDLYEMVSRFLNG